MSVLEDFDLVIFGGAGDLSMRKLIPALYHRDCDGQYSSGSRIIAVGRNQMQRSRFIESVGSVLKKEKGYSESSFRQFSDRISYLHLDATRAESWQSLCESLAGNENRIRAVYLATPPALFGPIAEGLRANDLIVPDMRIILEKPVGHDLVSAREINNQVGGCFAEHQIYRIDHYLGKETVQNLLALRFSNALFEPVWRREVIDHVQITVAEELGVENRIDFYNEIGALRDMVQNHLLQLVCLVAMEPPASLDDDTVRDEKIKVLRALRPIEGDECLRNTVRAQYARGLIGDDVVPGYADGLGQSTQTETFVAIRLGIDNWRWSGVPFYLRTGKRLPRKHSEIIIQFKPVPHEIFGGRQAAAPNRLSIMLQPNEGMQLRIMAKEPGTSLGLKPVSLDLSLEETYGIRYSNAYERLVVEALKGNPALFMRRDEVESAWRWIDELRSGWQAHDQPMESYAAGTWGPAGASMLLDRSGRSWSDRL